LSPSAERELSRRKLRSGATALIESYSMLFLAVLLGVRLRCLLSVPMGVKLVGARCEGMMCRFLVMSGLICFDRFPMVSGGVRAMFC
jgi:hypothetical protein